LTDVSVVIVQISNGDFTGRGECRPYARYNETTETVTAQIENIRDVIESGLSLEALQSYLPAGAARNAVDCALWDLHCKMTSQTIWDVINHAAPQPQPTAYTLSVDHPSAMAKAAREAGAYEILKLKVDAKRMSEQITLSLMQMKPLQQAMYMRLRNTETQLK